MLSWHRVIAVVVSMLSVLVLLVGFTWPVQSHEAMASTPGKAPERELFLQSNLLPSVYLNYQSPTSRSKKTWFSTVMVHDSQDSTFFAVQRTQFGYLGLQEERTLMGALQHALGLHFNSDVAPEYYGLVIFSVWDVQDCTGFACSGADKCNVLAVGDGAYQNSFGREGTGCQIKLTTSWGKVPYSFVTTAEDIGNDRVKLSGYWHDATHSPWRFVGSISVKKNGRTYGDGGISSFIEQYRSIDSHEVRTAEFGPQFVETTSGEWLPITAATFRATATSTTAYHLAAVTHSGTQFLLGVSGTAALPGQTPSHTYLSLRSTPHTSHSPQLLSWIQLRNSGNLPQGCAGGSCGVSAFFSGIVDFLIPSNLQQVLLRILEIGLLAVIAWMMCQCCR